MADNKDTIKWLREVEDVPKRAVDPLADEVLHRFNGAVGWQTAEKVNGKPLRHVLLECWEQQNGLLSVEDAQRAKAVGVNAIINLTALKTGIAVAYLNEAMTSGSAELPWVIKPTPRPDISQDARQEILAAVKMQLFNNGFTDGIAMVEAIKQLKRLIARQEQEKAEKSAEEMTLLFQDQCAEGGFSRALSDFIQYFPVYPFAVFAGPIPVKAPRLVWGTRKPRMSSEVFPQFRAISPFDFAYTPDSPDTQRGTAVFTRTLWTRKQLIDAAKLPTFITANVLDVLKNADEGSAFDLDWLTHSPDAPAHGYINLWSSNVHPIEVLTHYGIFSGRELQSYGFTGLELSDYYNTEIVMAGYRVIQVKVMSDPKLQTRPIYTASFYKTGGDRIAGDGIAQRLRDIERAYMTCLRYLIRNAANASAPVCEADYKRVTKYMNEEELKHIVPGTMYLTDAGPLNSPALKFFSIPSNMGDYTKLMELFMQLADRITNIPAQLHGEAVGSGAMRTFRGMSLLQGSATKAFHAAVENISEGVFEPLGERLYNLNMLYSSDISVKGDTQVIVKGAAGILQAELDRQNAAELLQIVGAVGAQLGGMVNIGPAISYAIIKLLGTYNLPDDVMEALKQPPPMMVAPAGGKNVGAGMNPNSNPNPAPMPGEEGGVL